MYCKSVHKEYGNIKQKWIEHKRDYTSERDKRKNAVREDERIENIGKRVTRNDEKLEKYKRM